MDWEGRDLQTERTGSVWAVKWWHACHTTGNRAVWMRGQVARNEVKLVKLFKGVGR